MNLRAAGATLALLVAAGGITDAVTAGHGERHFSPSPGMRTAAAAPAGHLAAAAQRRTTAELRTTLTTPVPETVWVNASVTTVWIKPGKARKVDAPALRAQPDIARWINRQSLRQRNDLTYRVMTQALHGDKLVRLTQRDGWSKVKLPDQTGNKFRDGIIGWVPTRQLTLTKPARRVLQPGVQPHGNGRDALRIARSYLGVRYLWGGMSQAGLDCSGLTYRVFRSLGVVLPRDAADQSKIGTPVRRSELRRGDLVSFGTGGWAQIHHVGIYAGNKLVLHAPHTGTRVQLTPLRMWSDYWGARRVR
jgi:cell wall-associated NlpC family hydrolase